MDAGVFCYQSSLQFGHRIGALLCWALKYSMNTYRANVRVTINGRSQTVKTEVRAPSTQDARWLLRAMYGFHSIQSGPLPR